VVVVVLLVDALRAFLISPAWAETLSKKRRQTAQYKDDFNDILPLLIKPDTETLHPISFEQKYLQKSSAHYRTSLLRKSGRENKENSGNSKAILSKSLISVAFCTRYG
jgi:hypothetical protein